MVLGRNLLNFNAETRSRWCWGEPSSHVYESVELDQCGSGHAKWEATIDLLTRTWRRGEETGALDAEGLARLLASDSDLNAERLEDREGIEALLSVLESLGNGTFYPARHHAYYFERPFHASYQHFTLGMGLGPPLVVLWCLVWPVYLVVRRKAYRGARASPGKVYLVTLGVVVAADALCILLHVIFSPGPVSELMEWLLGLVNLPALILLGTVEYISGAVMWATLCSIVAALRARRQLSASAEAR